VLRSNLQTLQETRNRRLNTPKSSNIDELFSFALGLPNMSSKWSRKSIMTADEARTKLDNFVELRGEIAHRGKTPTVVTKEQVETYHSLIRSIAAQTGGAVNTYVRGVTGQALFYSNRRTIISEEIPISEQI
jgi:RiboL-PSP-HEPN